jgi:hypothetical protein
MANQGHNVTVQRLSQTGYGVFTGDYQRPLHAGKIFSPENGLIRVPQEGTRRWRLFYARSYLGKGAEMDNEGIEHHVSLQLWIGIVHFFMILSKAR